MRHSRKMLYLVIGLLAVGFASVSTSLVLSGTVGIGVNSKDYKVIFTKAESMNGGKTEITANGKRITYTNDKIRSEDILRYEISNESTIYDTVLTIDCDVDNRDYIGLVNRFEDNVISKNTQITIRARESGMGELTLTLKKLPVEEVSVGLTCTIIASAVEKDVIETKPISNETYMLGGQITTSEDEMVSGGIVVVYSNNKKVSGIDEDGYFYVSGLEKGSHEVYYLANKTEEEISGLNKDDIEFMATAKGRTVTGSNEIEFEGNGYKAINVKTDDTSILKTITLKYDGKELTRKTGSDTLIIKVDETNENTWTNISSSNESKAEYKDGQIVITNIKGNSKVNLGTTLSNTVSLLDTTETNIKMLKNEIVTAQMSIPSNRKVSLDLNGKKIEQTTANHFIFQNYGQLNIDSSQNGGSMKSIKGVVLTNGTTNVYRGYFINTQDVNDGFGTLAVHGGGKMNVYGEMAQFDADNNYISGTYVLGAGNSPIICPLGEVNLYGGLFESTGNMATVRSNKDITEKMNINIYDGKYISNANTIELGGDCNENSTINIYGGEFISKNIVLANLSTGTINVIQTENSIYITTLCQVWRPAIVNSSTGTINISAKAANKCTTNASDTISGLCVYAEGTNTTVTSNTNNGAIQNNKSGIINIDGGTYYGRHQGINNGASGTINIRNATVISEYYAVLNNRSGYINVCDSTIKGYFDLRNSDTDNENVGTINYNNNTIFSDGTNIPNISGNTSKIISNYTGTCRIEE